MTERAAQFCLEQVNLPADHELRVQVRRPKEPEAEEEEVDAEEGAKENEVEADITLKEPETEVQVQVSS